MRALATTTSKRERILAKTEVTEHTQSDGLQNQTTHKKKEKLAVVLFFRVSRLLLCLEMPDYLTRDRATYGALRDACVVLLPGLLHFLRIGATPISYMYFHCLCPFVEGVQNGTHSLPDHSRKEIWKRRKQIESTQ